MLPDQLSYVIPEKQDASELVSLLRKRFTVRELPETVNKRVYYDTFDWRLYKHGASLEKHEEGNSSRIYWRSGRKARLKNLFGLNKVPTMANKLPAGKFREQLQSIISVRELTPRLKLKVKRQPFAVLDNHEKVVVRVYLDKFLYNPSKTRAAKKLGMRLTITPVKGYLKDYQKVEAFIKEIKLRPAEDNQMKLALLAMGVSPGDYTNKLNIMLDPESSSEQAVKNILHRLLEIIQLNTSGCIRGRDTEFMHHYRVAIRKTRSVLKQIKGVLSPDISEKYKQFFSLLGKLTNPVRDFDVFLLKLEGYQHGLSKSAVKSLQPFREYLEQSRAEAQEKYVAEVKSSQYQQDIDQWQSYLESSAVSDQPGKNTDKPVYKLSDELIWEVYQEALTQGNAITDDSTHETLHELRKTFKKLRYLIEFFRSLYPTKKIQELLSALTGMQDNLGDFNDLAVHIGIIQGFIEHSSDEAAVNACKQIIETLERQQQETRTHFADCYTAFSAADNEEHFRELFIDYHASR